MGGAQSRGNLLESVEILAYNLITKQSWKDMTNMENKSQCDKLIVLTSKVLKKHLNDRELIYLAQRVKDGVVTNITTTAGVSWMKKSELEKTPIIYKKK